MSTTYKDSCGTSNTFSQGKIYHIIIVQNVDSTKEKHFAVFTYIKLTFIKCSYLKPVLYTVMDKFYEIIHLC